MFDHKPQCFCEPEDGIGRFTRGIREIRDSKKRAINVIVTVDKQEFHRKRLILDSECMIPHDQGVTEEWILRVDGREYGPANIETLREWKAEGRVLPANEARRADAELWSLAAGIQIITTEIAAGRRIGFFAALNDAVRFWPRIAALCIFVYGVFFLLIVFAFLIAAMIVGGASSVFVILLALALLGVQIWMFGRFFVNVLFWQQFAVLENAGVIDSLRERRNLASSGSELPWFQRPLWRGVFIASLWFALVLAIALVSEWTTLQHSLNELMTIQDPQTLLQKLTEAQQAHGFDVLSFALGIVQKILQPLIGIAFVLLYFDSRKER